MKSLEPSHTKSVLQAVIPGGLLSPSSIISLRPAGVYFGAVQAKCPALEDSFLYTAKTTYQDPPGVLKMSLCLFIGG